MPPPPCLQKGKPRHKESAWAGPQGWSTSAQPGPSSGPSLREVGCFAHTLTNADSSTSEVSFIHPSCCQPSTHKGGHTEDKGGQTERAYTGPRKANTVLLGFAEPDTGGVCAVLLRAAPSRNHGYHLQVGESTQERRGGCQGSGGEATLAGKSTRPASRCTDGHTPAASRKRCPPCVRCQGHN